MRLVLATDQLVVAGRSYKGFPLLVGEDGHAVEPAQSYLWWRLVERPRRAGAMGPITSELTWERYGQAMYDFFGYALNPNNGVDWKAEPLPGYASALQGYQGWSYGTLGLSPRTVNQRVSIIEDFYTWALQKGFVEKLPYDRMVIRNGRNEPGFMAHAKEDETKESSTLRLRVPKSFPKFLTKEQVNVCWADLRNPTHRLMFEMMVRTGLRQIECRTFPMKYVFDPRRRNDLIEGRKIKIDLDPRDMKLKFDKPRTIDMPYDLMEDLYWYSVRYRQKRERKGVNGIKCPVIFLTEEGMLYTESAVTKIFGALSSRVGFTVHPHQLRHTYATYTLHSLRKSHDPNIGEPIQYLADRLGHSHISSTMIYVHLLNSLDVTLVLMHEDEMDQLFAFKDNDDGETEEL